MVIVSYVFPFVDLRKKGALIVNELKALNRRLEEFIINK